MPMIWKNGNSGDFHSGVYQEWDAEALLSTITAELTIMKIMI
ncbi:MAG: hypothetical protein NZ770_06605 [Candidatus Poseidoniaceae archaeon]|nr:hypothetical protein [Candidatus Poseidoniaceae archaeon]